MSDSESHNASDNSPDGKADEPNCTPQPSEDDFKLSQPVSTINGSLVVNGDPTAEPYRSSNWFPAFLRNSFAFANPEYQKLANLMTELSEQISSKLNIDLLTRADDNLSWMLEVRLDREYRKALTAKYTDDPTAKILKLVQEQGEEIRKLREEIGELKGQVKVLKLDIVEGIKDSRWERL
ncbi:hypothetical protein BJ508DRAFT_320399 [Ascobolus immersus RN42]|uniref:Uncharacterized protein n=1 Tax=Ascobolus immersus RN42 TaxID=1160509 RepID=A0A3N4IVP2_ASCIM|nr:hypothetical protein BJ508DRAFT_320399 [Ascobolus immersus RN42]